MSAIIKEVRNYWECKRCKINSLTIDSRCPCPRGGCEAKIVGKTITTTEIKMEK